MKKFILTTFVFGLLVIGSIGVLPFLIKVAGPGLMKETKPLSGVPFGYREFPIPERSLVAVKLDLPIDVLAGRVNQDFPSVITGVERKDLHKKIKNSQINWTINPGKLSLSNSGKNLSYDIPFTGLANATGNFGAFNIPVKGNADMNGSVRGSLTPTIERDWQVSPNLTTTVQVNHAMASLGKRDAVDARENVLAALNSKIKDAESRIGPSLTHTLNLKTGIQNLWTKAHITKLMIKEPGAWLVFDPVLAQMGPIDYSNPSAVSLTVGMVAQTFITNTEAQNRPPEAVPCLEFLPTAPVSDIRIPIIANLQALNLSLAQQAFLIRSDLGPTLKILHPTIELADEGKFNLSVDLNAQCGIFGDNISGRITVEAQPIVDCQTQSFGFTDVKLTMKSREAMAGAACWIFEEMIVKAIEQELRFDLNDHLPKIETEIQKVVNATKVPEGLELFFENPKITLLGVYTIEKNGWNEPASPGIVFVFGARGDISVKVSKI